MAPHKAIAHVSHVPEEYVLEELELKDMWTVQDYARVNNYEFVLGLKQVDPELENMWNKPGSLPTPCMQLPGVTCITPVVVLSTLCSASTSTCTPQACLGECAHLSGCAGNDMPVGWVQPG
jgi:hypothetical protein